MFRDSICQSFRNCYRIHEVAIYSHKHVILIFILLTATGKVVTFNAFLVTISSIIESDFFFPFFRLFHDKSKNSWTHKMEGMLNQSRNHNIWCFSVFFGSPFFAIGSHIVSNVLLVYFMETTEKKGKKKQKQKQGKEGKKMRERNVRKYHHFDPHHFHHLSWKQNMTKGDTLRHQLHETLDNNIWKWCELRVKIDQWSTLVSFVRWWWKWRLKLLIHH